MPDLRFPERADYPDLKWLEGHVLSPALVIFVEHVRHNIQTVVRALGGDVLRWRPHIKTIKIPCILRELVDAGIRRFKCATSKEARVLLETLSSAGIEQADLLFAYPCRGPMLRATADLARRYRAYDVSVLVDSMEAVRDLPPELGCFVDINPGMNRTGVPIEDTKRILAICEQAGQRLKGLHHYEGHLAALEPTQRRAKAHACFDALVEVVDKVEGAGLCSSEVITSGTPTFLDALDHPALSARQRGAHTVSPGTVVYHDLNSEKEIPELRLQPAALLFSRAISCPCDGVMTFDVGSKSLAAEMEGPPASIWGFPEYEAMTPSEEHFPWIVPSARAGESVSRHPPVLMVPAHVCPTVNLAQEAILIRATGEPSIVDVSARAHDLRYPPTISPPTYPT